MVSSSSFLSEFKTARVDPEAAPRLMVGAASPLWLMFGGAAAAGATWWWWASRWREAVNLEAMLALTPEPVSTPIPEPEVLAVEAIETIEAAVEAVVEPAKIVAEAAVETAVETVEAANDTVVESAEAAAEIVESIVSAPIEAEPVVAALVADAPVIETPPVAEASAEIAEAVEASAEAAIETSAEAVKVLADDLTRVVGIGPKLAASLGELGVTSFSQIAAWTPDELQSFDQLLNLKGRADRDAWIAQAKRFAGAPEA
jgi:predicted flap endonuclease-1-like 5' DNA nuclease